MNKTLFIAVCALLFGGCASNPKRASIDALGAAGGALAGNAIGHGDKAATIGGAFVGAGVSELAQGRDTKSFQAGVDYGYALAESDDAKRRFFEQQARNAQAGGAGAAGRMVYYVFDEGGKETADGRIKTASSKVAVPVYEPEPVGQ